MAQQITRLGDGTLFITDAQYVGIGTNDPNEILTVVGNVSACNVFVTSTISASSFSLGAGAGSSSNWDSVYTSVNSNSANWNTAYGWGNHATAGYLTSETSHADVLVDGDFSSQGIMLRGSSAGSYSILTNNSANWNTAYGWGNHATAGYQSALTFGIANTNALKVDDADAADNDYAKFTANGLEGRSAAEVRTDLNIACLGRTTHSLTNLNTEALWSQPAGYQTMVRATSSCGLPDDHGQSYFGYTITSRRDTGGGYSALLTAYDNSELWFTYQGSCTSYPTWRRIWHDNNHGDGSGLNADCLDGTHASGFLLCTGMPNNTDTWLNFRVIRNANSSSSNDGMFIGYSNCNSGLTRLYGGGSTSCHSLVCSNGLLYHSSGNRYVYQGDQDVMMRRGTITTNDWNDFIDGTESSYYQVNAHSGSNRPVGSYTYGTAINFSSASAGKFQLYAPHNGSEGCSLWYRTGWNTDYDAWAKIWDSANDGDGSGLHADCLDGQEGAYYLDYSNFTNTPTIPTVGAGCITISAGTDLSTGGGFNVNQAGAATITIDHSDITRTDTTSTASPANGGTVSVIDSITSNARGHITAANVKTITLPSNAANADTVGGFSASQFVRSDANDTKTGNLDFTSNGACLSLSNYGRVGVGMNDPQHPLEICLGDNSTFTTGLVFVQNSGNRGSRGHSSGSALFQYCFSDHPGMILNKDGNVGIGTDDPSSDRLKVSGTVCATGDINGSGNLSVTGTIYSGGTLTSGTALRICNNSNIGIIIPTTLTGNRTYTLQNASGTLAHISDIPTDNSQLANSCNYCTSDTNTTYSVTTVDVTGSAAAKLRLSGSDSTTDDITFAVSQNLTIEATPASDLITITGPDLSSYCTAAYPTVGAGCITLTAGTDLSDGGDFNVNQAGASTITFNHSDITRTDTSDSSTATAGGTIDVIDSITSNARGHITAANVKTITLPSNPSVVTCSNCNYVYESSDSNSERNITYLGVTGGGNGYKRLEVDNGGLTFNAGTNRLWSQVARHEYAEIKNTINSYISTISTSNGLTTNRSLYVPNASGTIALTSQLYSGWELYTECTCRATVSSGNNVNFIGGSNVTITYGTGSGNCDVTISHSDTSTLNGQQATTGQFVKTLTVDDRGHVTAVTFDTAGGSSPSSATTSAEGVVELATNSEVTTGTDTSRVITPSNLTSITKLGTIATGTWQGTPIADSYISSAANWNSCVDGGQYGEICVYAWDSSCGMKASDHGYVLFCGATDVSVCGNTNQYDNAVIEVSYTGTSDYRQKYDIEPFDSGYDIVNNVDVYSYKLKDDCNNEVRNGMMAHELQEAGQCFGVYGTKDGMTEDNKPEYQKVEYPRLVPTLWSALKTAMCKIEDLENRLATLELQSNT